MKKTAVKVFKTENRSLDMDVTKIRSYLNDKYDGAFRRFVFGAGDGNRTHKFSLGS